MRTYCITCWRRHGTKVPATQHRTPAGWSDALCPNCEDARNEAADQRFLESFFGGAAPQYVYDATYRITAAERERGELLLREGRA